MYIADCNLWVLIAVFKALDNDSDGFLNQEEWIKGLSIFLRGSLEEKMTCECNYKLLLYLRMSPMKSQF